MKMRLHQKTLELLAGLKGIEIGASAHNDFGVDSKNLARADGPDRELYDMYQRRMGNDPAPIDIDADAHDTGLKKDSVDFVISSHVVEHLANPIKAFREWKRIVKPGGYIIMIIPLRNTVPEDAKREITTMEELQEAYKNKAELTYEGPDAHLWVFDIDRMKEIVDELNSKGRWSLGWELVWEENPDQKVKNGFYLAYKQIGGVEVDDIRSGTDESL